MAPLSGALDGTRYRLLGSLGRGGMGEVVEAEHVTLGKRVAIKILHARFASRPDLADRMRIEAQALARLSHPNLVQVNDFGQTDDGRPFFVMERLHGRTLGEELARQIEIPCADAVAITRQMLAGLAAAHQMGIIHRDIKLENVFLCDANEPPRPVKLLDFGIAKVILPDGDSRSPAPLAFPTREGVSMGTPRFFSPEQALGRRVDARTDIYSTGLVLYALLAGRGPFDHLHSLPAIMQAHARQIPEPPSHYAQQPIPPELDRIVMRALAKSPDDRFRSAALFSAELADVPAPRTSAPQRRWAVTEPLPVNRFTPAPSAPSALPVLSARPAPPLPPPPPPPHATTLPALSTPVEKRPSVIGFFVAMVASAAIAFIATTALLLRMLD